MAMQAKKGTVAANTGTGNQSVTGFGFAPKALIVWVTAAVADVTFTANEYLSVGIGVSSTARGCIAFAANDGSVVPNQVTRRLVTGKLLRIENASFTALFEADLVSLDSGGFTINVTTAGSAYIIHYLALGGSDLTNANVLTNQTTDITLGAHAHTGLGFQPDFLLMLHAGGITTADANSTNSEVGIGATDGVDQASAVMEVGTGSNPTAAGSYEVGTSMISALQAAGATRNFEAAITSLDALGWTWNVSIADSAAHPILVLGLKGGQYAIKTDTQRTSTGTKQTTGFGFQPVALLFASTNVVSSAAVNAANGRYSIGGTDGTTDGSAWVGFTTGSTTTFTSKAYSDASKTLVLATTPSTLNAAASISSLDGDGFTLNWTTADATAREFVVVGFGSNPAPATDEIVALQAVQRASLR